jgi:Protein of unknown function (DUF1353)
MKAAFLTPLTVQQKPEDDSQDVASGRGVWTLVAPLEYQSEAGPIYSVPIGFKTDFASVPRVPVIFDAFGDRANLAATLHDWLYTKDPATGLHPVKDRETADLLLKEAALAQGCSMVTAEALYLGVRAGGESHWEPDDAKEAA